MTRRRHNLAFRTRPTGEGPTAEGRLHALLAAANEMLAMLGADGSVEYCTPSFERTLGYAPAELVGTNIFALTHPDDRGVAEERFAAMLGAHGATVSARLRIRHRDGRWRIIQASTANLLGDRDVGCVVLSATDVTDPVESETTLRRLADGLSLFTRVPFFEALVLHLARLLRADFALVGETVGPSADAIRTLAVCGDGAIMRNFEYPLRDTPCATVVGRVLCTYPSGVRALFPEDRMLAEMGVESYVGVPLFDTAGVPLGLLVAMSRRALSGVERAESVLRIAAARAAAELQRIRTEEALRSSAERLRLATENADIGVWDWDIENSQVAYSPHWDPAIATEGSREAAGDSWIARVHPDDRARCIADLAAALDEVEPRPYRSQFRTRQGDGSYRWILSLGTLVRDPGGRPTRMLGVHVDITDRRRADDERLLLAAAVEQAAEAVLVTDAAGVVVYVNRAFEALSGYRRDEVVGRNPRLLQSGRHDRAFYEAMWAALMRGEPWAGAFVNRHRDGSEYEQEAVIFAVRDARGEVINYVELSRDASRERAMEAELRRLNSELEQRVEGRTAELAIANRELEAFSYSVAHDLRAPLRAIDGFCRALGDEYGGRLDDQGLHYLGRTRAAAQRMGRLIDGLLQMSRVARSELSWGSVDLGALARAILADLSAGAPDRVVEVLVAAPPPRRGDPELLRLVLENLLSNAWKYTARHARARIEFGSAGAEGEPVYFVRDDGAGFDMAHADKLFGFFQRLHGADEFEGTGIGLATARRIIERHGGRIWAEAAVERGATFFFTLGAGCARAAPLGSAARESRREILISALARQLSSRTLRQVPSCGGLAAPVA